MYKKLVTVFLSETLLFFSAIFPYIHAELCCVPVKEVRQTADWFWCKFGICCYPSQTAFIYHFLRRTRIESLSVFLSYTGLQGFGWSVCE